ncbi:MAG: restriction endonuclease [Gammaproteobacteria bacterium]|nr:MAG: restriction endonuclease [Gammaproteobacteria bacterium]
MKSKVLRLNKAGVPIAWLTWQQTATLLVRDQVIWTLGTSIGTLHGGYNRAGERSCIELPSIIACSGKVNDGTFTPALNNTLLFARDRQMCLYCGEHYRSRELSRDHVVPTSKGGRDIWTNVVSACRRCNNRKGNHAPEEVGMQLLAVPFAPNRHEYFYLANRDVLADQMDFLSSRFSRNASWIR